MIVDCHVHILNAEDAHLRTLLDAADRCGIHKLCISSLGRNWTEFPSAGELEEAASDVAEACARYPERLIGGVYVSADHVSTSMELLRRYLQPDGCRFVKLWVSQFADDSRLNPIVACCVERNAPILAPELPWERSCIEAPAICRHAGRLFMFYGGGYNNEPQQIGCAVSDDGVRWTRLS
ncbi:MAG: hypothetical protein NTU83_14620, partial [Candidatus Hydrogenedentes bacterium]|nr:hypothetical protein [Candidatus Hydrogenedentota bacterium]